MRKIDKEELAATGMPIILFLVVFITLILTFKYLLDQLEGSKVYRITSEFQQEWFGAEYDTIKIIVPPIPLPDSTEVLNGGSN